MSVSTFADEDEGGSEYPESDRSKPQPDTIPAGQQYLAYDSQTGEWSLWQRSDDRMFDIVLVGWQGDTESREESYTHWDLGRYALYHVEPDDAALIVMGARHLDTPAWAKFAARYEERVSARKPVG